MAVTDKERSRAYRERMQAKGLRPIQFWVPDTHSDSFADEARAQSQRAAQADAASDTMDFLEAVAAPWDE